MMSFPIPLLMMTGFVTIIDTLLDGRADSFLLFRLKPADHAILEFALGRTLDRIVRNLLVLDAALVRGAEHDSVSVDGSVGERLPFVLGFLGVSIGESVQPSLDLAR